VERAKARTNVRQRIAANLHARDRACRCHEKAGTRGRTSDVAETPRRISPIGPTLTSTQQRLVIWPDRRNVRTDGADRPPRFRESGRASPGADKHRRVGRKPQPASAFLSDGTVPTRERCGPLPAIPDGRCRPEKHRKSPLKSSDDGRRERRQRHCRQTDEWTASPSHARGRRPIPPEERTLAIHLIGRRVVATTRVGGDKPITLPGGIRLNTPGFCGKNDVRPGGRRRGDATFPRRWLAAAGRRPRAHG
jgi:hypothetical protein